VVFVAKMFFRDLLPRRAAMHQVIVVVVCWRSDVITLKSILLF